MPEVCADTEGGRFFIGENMKDTILLFTSIKEPVEAMTDEEAGKLFKAILSYQTTGEYELDGLLNVIFLQIKQQIDYNNEQYEESKRKKSIAGKKGMENRWHNKDNNVITEDNNVINVIENDNTPITSDNKNNLYVNVYDNVNVNDNVFITLLLEDGVYEVTKEEIEESQKNYPNIDVEESYRKMAEWLQENPSKRKSRNGIKRFITGWLSREKRYDFKKLEKWVREN